MNFAFKRRFRALNLATRTAWRNRGRPRIPGPWVPGSQHPDSLLLITLDSCRFDTLSSCSVPVISGVGPIHKVMAPSYFTYASHAAMFVGFTPGDGMSQEAIVNPKCGKLVRLHGGGSPSRANDRFVLRGRSMMEGFNNAGYITAGTGAVKWFDDSSDVGRLLVQDFQHYMYAGNAWSLRKQLHWLSETVGGGGGQCLHSSILARRMFRITTKVRPGATLMSRAARLQVPTMPWKARGARPRV